MLVLTACGVTLRLAFLFLAGDLEPFADESNYLYLSLIWNHFSFYSDGMVYLWPPGYPFLLSILLQLYGEGGVFAIKLVQVLLSGVIGWMTMLLASRFFSWRTVFFAGILWCVHLPLIGFTHLLWPETLFLSLFLPGFYLLVRWWQRGFSESADQGLLIAAGLILGISLLIKEVGLWWCVLVGGLIVYRGRKDGLALACSSAALFLLSVGVIVLPWTLRNYEVYGRFAPVGTTLGQNVFGGLNGFYMNFDYPKRVQSQVEEANALIREWLNTPVAPIWERSTAMNIIDQSAENVQQGIQYSLDHPGYTLRTRIKKLADWTTPLPFFVRHYILEKYQGVLNDPLVRKVLIVTALLLPMLVLAGALGGIFFCLRGVAAGPLLICTLLYFSVAGSLIIGMSRYRICIEPLLIMLAAAFLCGNRRPWRQKMPAVLCGSGWVLLIALWCVNAAEVWTTVQIIW
ncbi:MAG: glycosyltransferase family 39 protein [Planctomycetes bacterium]|nr:glycosyltransferase family 39 protein [Planctomycetota bacterium]